MLNASELVLQKYAGSDIRLSDGGREIVTYLVIVTLANLGAGIASLSELRKLIGEQNLDKATADRLSEKFQKAEKIEGVKLKYMNDEHSPGPHFDPSINRPHGRVGGPSEATTRRAREKGHLDGRSISIDSPEIRLHELGHAANHARKLKSSRLYGIGPLAGSVASFILAASGKPAWAGLAQAIGESPRLLEEWRASAHAKRVLRAELPKEEADKAFRVLNRAFRTYLYGAAASTVASAAYGWSQKAKYLGKGQR